MMQFFTAEVLGMALSNAASVCFPRQVNVLLICLQVSANGNVLRSEIVGSIKMRVFLSGMPELRLGLNDKVLFENTGREFALLSGSSGKKRK